MSGGTTLTAAPSAAEHAPGRTAGPGRRGLRPVLPRGILILSLVPAALILVAVAGGPGVSPDSTSYLAAARSLAESGRLIDWTGEPLTLFPPGYPLTLAAVHALGIPLEAAGVLINCVACSGIVVISYLIARMVTTSVPFGFAVAALVAVSPWLPRNGSWLWSDPIFTLVAMLATLVLVWLWTHPDRLSQAFLWVALLVSMATGIRYIGLYLVPVVFVVFTMVARRTETLRRSVVWGLTAAGAASLGAVVVVIRNLALGSGPLGPRYPGGRSAGVLWEQSIDMLARFAAPWYDSSPPSWIGWGVLVLTVGGMARAAGNRDGAMLTVAGAMVSFWGLLWWSELTSPIDPINLRLTMPGFAPLVITACFGLRALVQFGIPERQLPGGLRATSLVVGLSTLVLAVAHVGAGISLASRTGAAGQGFNSVSQRDSPVASAVTPRMCGAGVAATDPWLTYWVSACTPVQRIPLRSQAVTHKDAIEDLRQDIERGRIRYLVYVKGDTAVPPESLGGDAVRFRLAAKLGDGSIYEAVR